jgi:hypothetical protein
MGSKTGDYSSPCTDDVSLIYVNNNVNNKILRHICRLRKFSIIKCTESLSISIKFVDLHIDVFLQLPKRFIILWRMTGVAADTGITFTAALQAISVEWVTEQNIRISLRMKGTVQDTFSQATGSTLNQAEMRLFHSNMTTQFYSSLTQLYLIVSTWFVTFIQFQCIATGNAVYEWLWLFCVTLKSFTLTFITI